MRYVAVYTDREGASYSCPVTKSGNDWMLCTANGLRPITFYIPDDSVAGQLLTFHDYRVDGLPPSLRSCDARTAIDQMYARLPIPQKPAVAPAPPQEPEQKLHVERRAGESNFQALQRANAQQRIAPERKHREQSRAEAQNVTVDPAKVAAARAINNQIAETIKPRGRGQAILIERKS